MRTVQGNVLQSLRTVQAFLEENAERLPGVVDTGARRMLGETIAELSMHATEQSGGWLASQGATQKQRKLRRVLLQGHMAPISRIVRSAVPPVPEVEPFRMPSGKPTAERLAAAAYGMAQAAEPHAELFTSAGLPDDFVVQLTGAADAMLASLDERAQHRAKRCGATKGLKTKLSQGRRIVHVLDAFVKTALDDDPALLANWNTVKRVQKVPVRSLAATPSIPGDASRNVTAEDGVLPMPALSAA